MTTLAPPPVQPPPVASETLELRRDGAEIARLLAVLIYNARLHDPGNEVFVAPLERLRPLLAATLAREGRLQLLFLGPDLFVNGVRLRPQVGDATRLRSLERCLFGLGLGGLRVAAAADAGEISRLLTALVAAPPGIGAPAMNDRLRAAAIESFEVLPMRDAEVGESDRRTRALRAYEEAVELIRGYMTSQQSPAQINARKAKRIVHRLVDLSFEGGEGFSLAGLAAIRGHDAYTFNHMVNVCVLAIAFGRHLGMSRVETAQLGLAALYHDVGKLHVPLEVLNKRGKMTDAEWALMGNHTVFAARTLFPLVARSADALPRVLTALQHHLRYDGKGYPKLRVLTRQSLFTRITAIVDAFDAMTTLRIYQAARLPHEAMAELQLCSGKQYDPRLVRAFVECMGIYPIGSAVVLRSGELAVVCATNPEPDRLHQPRVRIVSTDQDLRSESELADLALPEMAHRQIAGTVDPELLGVDPAQYVY